MLTEHPVLTILLPSPRRSRILPLPPQRLRPTHSHLLHRLAPSHLLFPGNAHHQLHRENPFVRGFFQLLWKRGGVEGESGAVFGICEPGGGDGGWCDGASVEVCCARYYVAGALDGCCECAGECGGYDEVSAFLEKEQGYGC